MPNTTDRGIRVFISSTFRDMQQERDELVKRAFPQIRKLCEERGVTWGEVDLRWGITDEQKSEGDVLPICLAEIRGCRPYFIGLLGERYGWVPDEIPRDVVEDEPWLDDDRGRSVTELEILHGVLNDPGMAGQALFYFRSPGYIDAIPEPDRDALRELPSPEEVERLGPDAAERRAQERRDRLRELKQRIRDSGLPVREDYPDPLALGALVLTDLTAIINRLYPEGSAPDPVEREAAEHEAFARSRAAVYIGRQEYFDRLTRHADSDGPPLVVVGESGSGKSALLANWARQRRDSSRDELVLMHFIGASPYSADWAAMVRRVIGELQRHLGIDDDIPSEPSALRAAFARWLHMAAEHGRVTLVIDALDQLEDHDGAPDLVWLPTVIPPAVRVIVSTLPGRALDELTKRAAATLQVEPLQPGERGELIVEYLRQYGRTLGEQHVDRIARAPQAANPLYLRALLEELRVWGQHETLAQRIDHYLTASTIEALYELILERYEADYERDRPGLLRDSMSLLWAARRGLSETELMELLGAHGEPLPRAHWSPLYLAAEPSLVVRSGLIGFFHDYLRRAVRRRYLPDDTAIREAHAELARYFDQRRESPRAVDELPWQLAEAGSWQRLRDLLVDPEFFDRAWERDTFGTEGQSVGSNYGHGLRTYWARIEANSPFRLLDGCQALLDGPAGKNPLAVWAIAALLRGAGYRLVAADVMGRVADYFREANDAPRRARALGDRAALLLEAGEVDDAMPLLQEQERICRETDDQVGLQRSLGNQAAAYFQAGDVNAATPLLEEQERISRELGDADGIATSRMNQALVLKQRGDPDGALSLLDEAEQLRHALGDQDGLANVLVNRAAVLREAGQSDEALSLLRDAEALGRDVNDPAALEKALRGQLEVLREKGDLDDALRVVVEAEEMCRRMPDRVSVGHLQGLLLTHGSMLTDQRDYEGAAKVFEEHAEVCRRLGDDGALATSLHIRALMLVPLGRPAEALPLLEEAHQIAIAQGLAELADQIEPMRQVLRRTT